MKIETKTQNKELYDLISDLRKYSIKTGDKIWRKIALFLAKSKQNKVSVNLSKLNKFSKAKDIIIVPGKILSTGNFEKDNITLVSYSISQTALEKVNNSKSKYFSLSEFLKSNPKNNAKILV